MISRPVASDAGHPWRATKTGIRLAVRLTPRAAHDRVEGLVERPDGVWLAATVRAVAQKGQANDALTCLIAEWLGLPRRAVSLATGGQSRTKQVDITGEPDELVASIRAALEVPGGIKSTRH